MEISCRAEWSAGVSPAGSRDGYSTALSGGGRRAFEVPVPPDGDQMPNHSFSATRLQSQLRNVALDCKGKNDSPSCSRMSLQSSQSLIVATPPEAGG